MQEFLSWMIIYMMSLVAGTLIIRELITHGLDSRKPILRRISILIIILIGVWSMCALINTIFAFQTVVG